MAAAPGGPAATAKRIKVILTGSTGAAGAEALRQCIASPNIEHVVSISRRPPDVPPDPKLTVLVHKDFENYADVLPKLQGATACLWCLGISTRLVRGAPGRADRWDGRCSGATTSLQHRVHMHCIT